MNKELIAALLSGNVGPALPQCPVNEREFFLDALFGIKRMLVIKVNSENRESTVTALKTFSERHGLEFEEIDADTLTVDMLRGEVEFITISGQRCFRREKPYYWPVKRKMILIHGLKKNCDKDILRAFIDIGCLAGYSWDNLPDSKLPDSSGFIFLAGDDFPYEEFSAVSRYWQEESEVLDSKG